VSFVTFVTLLQPTYETTIEIKLYGSGVKQTHESHETHAPSCELK
jgi:hypothetical protein